jgi:hypothetical protein
MDSSFVFIIYVYLQGSCFRRNEASRETNNSLTFGPEEALAEQTVFL